MKPHWKMVWIFLVDFVLVPLVWLPCTSGNRDNFIIEYVVPADCSTGGANYHQKYDISHMECSNCAENSTLQSVTPDGYDCTCRENYRRRDEKSDDILTWSCHRCENDKILSSVLIMLVSSGISECEDAFLQKEQQMSSVASDDGYACVACDTQEPSDEELCPDCELETHITVERNYDGTWLVNRNKTEARECVLCKNDTWPHNQEPICVRCNQILQAKNGTSGPESNCTCPEEQESGGLCFGKKDDLENELYVEYTVRYDDDVSVDRSTLLMDHLRAAHASCKVSYSNLTACQMLGNMCSLLLYDKHKVSGYSQDACSMFLCLTEEQCTYDRHVESDITNWYHNMPWLYYEENTDNGILTDEAIPTIFTRGSVLRYKVAKYTLEGHYIGILDIEAGEIQMCKDDHRILDASQQFGTSYKRQCRVSVNALYDADDYSTFFYDMYLEYVNENDNKKYLYAVPVLIRNYQGDNNVEVNKDDDSEKWELVRRYFLVDRVAGQEEGDVRPQVVRYAKEMILHVTLQEDSSDGLIYPPYLEILYSQVTSEDYENDNSVEVVFKSEYGMNLSKLSTDLSIAIGVMSGLAFLYALFLTYIWQRRMGNPPLGLITLFKFLLFLCGALADAFFVVIFGFSLWWFFVYKGQSAIYMVPDDGINYYIDAYVGSAFALKCLHLMHEIFLQVTVDIFFVDWERPKKETGSQELPMRPDRLARLQSMQQKGNLPGPKTQQSVSIWRTYFVANEWNELQTDRRVNPMVHMLLLLLILNVAGVENLARFDMSTSVSPGGNGEYRGEFTKLFRFPLMASLYLLIGLVQWLLYVLIWSRFYQHRINDFVDLCSLCNISIFLSTHKQFGYYIHGRSPHGYADIGLAEMYINLDKEKESLCGTRGLTSGTDQQTYQVYLPKKLKSQYEKVIFAATTRPTMAGGARTSQNTTGLDSDTEVKMDAYSQLNRYIQSYIDHNLKDVDYIVQDKKLLEKIFDFETEDFDLDPSMGFFYPDSGHAFDETLFYGHEAMLQIFEILFFAVIDLIFESYILSGVLTYLMGAFIVMIRNSFGCRNIVKKTMVDKRFLI